MATSPPLLCIGIDPGRSASVSAVLRQRGRRPVLVGAWGVYGTTPAAWDRRLDAMVANLQAVADDHVGDLAAAVEVPANKGRTRKRQGKHQGPWTWLGMGRLSGRLEEAVRQATGVTPQELDTAAWPSALQVLTGKRLEGLHRVREATKHVQGWAELAVEQPSTTKADVERLICLAESALIAAALATITPWRQP